MEETDPIKDDPKYKEILSSVDEEIEKKYGDSPSMGFCHMMWTMKNKFSKESMA
jgi:hypothetical protein